MIKFLSAHPQVSFGGTGTFFTSNAKLSDAEKYYETFGMDSGPSQVLIERNPRLYLTPDVADLIMKVNPKMKIIFVGKYRWSTTIL